MSLGLEVQLSCVVGEAHLGFDDVVGNLDTIADADVAPRQPQRQWNFNSSRVSLALAGGAGVALRSPTILLSLSLSFWFFLFVSSHWCVLPGVLIGRRSRRGG